MQTPKRKWFALVTTLYVLTAAATYGLTAFAFLVWHQGLEWIWLALLHPVSQAIVFLAVAPWRQIERLGHLRILIAAIVTGFLLAMPTAIAAWVWIGTIQERRTGTLANLPIWPFLALGWMAWSSVLCIYSLGRSPLDVMRRQLACILATSLVILLLGLFVFPPVAPSAEVAGMSVLLGIFFCAYLSSWSLGLFPLWWRYRTRRVRGRCPKCGYDLRGLSEMRCPECGRTFTLDEIGATQIDLQVAGSPPGNTRSSKASELQ